MPPGADEHACRRAELLGPVKGLCARAGVATETGVLPPLSFGPGTATVLALRRAAADGSWDASVTVARARRLPPSARRAGREYSGDPRPGYDLDSPGELVYEVAVHEEDDGGSRHGPRPVVVSELAGAPQAAALAAAVDPAALCWFFPREHGGRYRRSAVVALAPCRDGRPHLSGPWLTARADGDRLWLRSVTSSRRTRRTAGMPPRGCGTSVTRTRRQHTTGKPATRATSARRLLAARRRTPVRARAVRGPRRPGHQHAAGRRTTRMFRAELTDNRVAGLHAGLADAAPRRLAAAYGTVRGVKAGTRSGRAQPTRGWPPPASRKPAPAATSINRATSPRMMIDRPRAQPRCPPFGAVAIPSTTAS